MSVAPQLMFPRKHWFPHLGRFLVLAMFSFPGFFLFLFSVNHFVRDHLPFAVPLPLDRGSVPAKAKLPQNVSHMTQTNLEGLLDSRDSFPPLKL